MFEKLKNYPIQSFKECLFFIFCLFYFLLLSNNTLHLMFYTYIVTETHFNNIIQIAVVKQSHERVTSKNICLFFIMLFLCLFLFCLDFVFSLSSPPPSLFNGPCVQLYLKHPNQSALHTGYKLDLRITYFVKKIHAKSFVFNFSSEIREN